MTQLRSTTTALALLLIFPGVSKGAPRVALAERVVIHSDTLNLADLLPTSAPSSLRAEARKVSMGNTPEPPMTRVIYRQQLQFLLQDHAPLLAELSLPPQIFVTRFHRMLTRKEVIAAIRGALGSEGLNRLPDLSDLAFAAPVYVTSADPGLKVIRISTDPVRRTTSFRLWTTNEPGNLPFTVSVPLEIKLPTLVARRTLSSGDIASTTDFRIEMRPEDRKLAGSKPAAEDLAGLETRGQVRQGAPVDRDQFARPVLVEPGALATLVVQGNGFNIKTIVTPLQQGVLGQEIRVRNNESRLVVEARVTGRDQLIKSH